MIIKKCLDCGKDISRYAIRCWQCQGIHFHKPLLCHNKEWLKEQYDKGLSLNDISKINNAGSPTCIKYWFGKFNLPLRPSPRKGFCMKENNGMWKGGIFTPTRGYRFIHHPEYHSYKTRNYYVAEHILVMEKKLGRKLSKPELVHHQNGITTDNRPENLKLFSNSSYHKIYEGKVSLFSKQLIFGDICPELKPKLIELLNIFLSKNE